MDYNKEWARSFSNYMLDDPELSDALDSGSVNELVNALYRNEDNMPRDLDNTFYWYKYFAEYLDENLVDYVDGVGYHSAIRSLKTIKFAGTDIKKIKLGKNIRYISVNAFAHCDQLEHVEIEADIAELPFGCFFQCYNLKYLKFPASVIRLHRASILGVSPDIVIDTPKHKISVDKDVLNEIKNRFIWKINSKKVEGE